jgi:oligopeptide transport system substrate-binding protein
MRPRSQRWRAFQVALLVGALALLVAGCAPSTPSASSQTPASTQILREALVVPSHGDLSLDPALVGSGPDAEPAMLVFPPLLTLDDHLQPQPWAAASWSVSDDGLTYTFQLNTGMQFSDGEPVDAAAFAFALNRVLDPCTRSPAAALLAPIKDAVAFAAERCNPDGTHSPPPDRSLPALETLTGDALTMPDPSTLVITLDYPAAYFVDVLASAPAAAAVPPHLVQQYGAGWTEHLTDRGGLGGSLFAVAAWDHAHSLTLRRNSGFWGAKPPLREITYTLVPSATAAYDAYLAGQLDVVAVPAADEPAARPRPDFHALPALAVDAYAMSWRVPPFDDARMRQAFALALDKQALASQTLRDTVLPTNHLVPAGMPGYNPDLKGPDGTPALTGNPDQARQLAQAYADDRCGGHLSGCPQVTLWLPAGDPAAQSEASAALAMWHAVMPGYPLALRSAPAATLASAAATGTLALWAVRWSGYPDPRSFLSALFLPDGSFAASAVSVPLASTLMQRADAEADPVQRTKDYQAAEQLLVAQVACLPLDQPRVAWLVRPEVRGYTRNATGLPSLFDIQGVSIAP